MSFITRCPSCGTSFRVVADQLKIADGWVRCGHCQQVFDATLDLQPAFAPAAPTTPAVSPPPSPAVPEPLASTQSTEPEAVSEPQEPVVVPETAVVPDVPESPRKEPQEPVWQEAPRAEPAFEPTAVLAPPEPSAPTDPVASSWSADEPEPVTAEAAEPSFVRQARRRAFWRRPWVRVVLALAALGLAVTLLGQATWHWRDAWAARYPQARPWLTAFCEHLGCSLTPPRRPRDVVIEGSVLLRRAPDRYSFHLVVRNNADIEVAAPALELTLTDLQDQVIARRVWPSDAWPQPTPVLPPGGEWPLQFELFFDHPQAARMTGYRALLFYP